MVKQTYKQTTYHKARGQRPYSIVYEN